MNDSGDQLKQNNEDEKYKQAQHRVKRIKSFYSSLITYVWVNALLIIINLLISPRRLWFFWVLIIWGLVLLIQALKIFTVKDQFLGEEWEKRKIRELMEKEKKNPKL